MNTKALLLLGALSLSACHEDDPPYDDIAGAYDAEIAGNYARVLISPSDAIAYLPDSGTIYAGGMSSYEGLVDGYLTRYRTRRLNAFSTHAVAQRSGPFEGELLAADEIEGDYYEGPVARTMSFLLDYDATFADVPLARLAGSYAIDNTAGDWLDLDITSSGIITGEDSSGCEFDGAVNNADLNVLPAQLHVDCPGQAPYSANATVSEFSFGGKHWITIAAYGRDQAWAAELPRS